MVRDAPRVALLSMLVVALLAPAARAADPLLEWRTLETPHFRVSFPDHLERLARHAARSLERAHRVLTPLLDHEPEGRTEVVLTDDTDSANGSATALPMRVIRLFAIPPFEFSPLQEYDDWLDMLITHEYTHVLHFDNIGGLATVVNAVLGRVWAPNQVSPRFVAEGFTTYAESTRAGTGGRIGSTLWDMYMRTAAIEDEILRLDQVIHVPMRWPHGEIPYVYGGYFVDFVVRRHGEETIGGIATDYGSDLLPFGISRALADATGEDAVELWDAFGADLRERFGAQRDAVVAAGLVEGTRVVTDAEVVRTPRFAPDGRRLGYYAYDGYDQPSLFAIDVETGERERLTVVSGQGAMTWAPDGRSFVYHRAEPYRGWYGFYDLFARRPDGSEVQLTDGMRAREPDLSPGGDRVAFVLAAPGGFHLATMSPDGTGTEIVLPGGEDVVIYTPRWSPDGKTIVFSAWLPGGQRDLYLFDVAADRLTRLTDDEAFDASPVFSPDGRRIFFSSDRTGIANIHALDPETGRTWRVTNVVGGAFHPDLSPDGKTLAFVGFVAKGYDLRTLELDPDAWVEVDTSTPVEIERLERPGGSPEDPAPGVGRSRPYDPWQTFTPRSWWIQAEPLGDDPTVSLSVLGNDVADQHAFSGTLDIGLTDATVGYALSYGYHGWYPSLSVAHWYGEYPRRDLKVGDENVPWTQDSVGAQADVTVPWVHGRWGQWFTARYRFEYTEPRGGAFEVPLDPNDPGATFPDTGVLSGVTLLWWFSTTRGATYPHGQNYGLALGTDVHLSHQALGSDFELIEWRAVATAYFRMPWVRSHSIAARLAGGIGRADFRSRGIFFLGGFPDQDLYRALRYGEAAGSTPLRGYDPWSVYGSRYAQLNFEYRLPIVDIDGGIWTVPAFLRRLAATAFCDAGAASWGELTFDDIKVGAGVELFATFSLAWFLEFSLRVGYGYGFMDPGGHDFYVVFGRPF